MDGGVATRLASEAARLLVALADAGEAGVDAGQEQRHLESDGHEGDDHRDL